MSVEALRLLAMSTLASSAAILLVLLMRRPLRHRFGAQVAYASWVIVPLLPAAFLLPGPAATQSLASTAATMAQILSPLEPAPAPAAVQMDPRAWIAIAWLFGLLCCALWLAHQQRRFVRALGRLVPDGDGLRAEALSGCPALIGAWRPRIVVPADFDTRFDPLERTLILAHERLHREHGDAQVNLVAALMRCVFWFNPLVQYASWRLRFDQELACDARVIARFPEARRHYADAMLKAQLADESRQDAGLPVGCYWQSSHPLKERIKMLRNPLPGRIRRAFGLVAIVCLAGGMSYTAWASKPARSGRGADVAAPPAAASAAPAGAALSGASYRSLRRIAYPQAPLSAGIEGVVYVKLRVAMDGTPQDVAADRSEPARASALAPAAVAGVKSWRFNSARRDGVAIASDEVIPIVFSLHPDSKLAVSGGTLDAIRVAPPEQPTATLVDTPPSENVTYRSMHPPKYPPEAVMQKLGGSLQMKVRVDEHGVPQEVEVASSKPPEAARTFAQASIEAIMTWRFNPGMKDGHPSGGWILVPIDFSLSDE